MKTIGAALAHYEMSNGGRYPDSLQVLVDTGAAAADAIRCPSAGGGRDGYFYHMPGRQTTGSDELIVCDLTATHKYGRNCLFGDGSIRGLNEAEFEKVLADPRNKAFADALRAVEKP